MTDAERAERLADEIDDVLYLDREEYEEPVEYAEGLILAAFEAVRADERAKTELRVAEHLAPVVEALARHKKRLNLPDDGGTTSMAGE